MGRYYRWALALVAPLLLTGCLLIPGKFESQLRLMNDGTYSFTYTGQMQMAEGDDNPMSSQSGMGDDDADNGGQQDDDQKNLAMSAIFGGAVPGDDEGLKKFAEQLAKYDGWNKVEYVGNNLFEVEYAVSGNFDQMFAFPTMTGATMQFPFVQIIRRSGGELEVLTPAMAGPGGLAGAMGPMPMGGSSEKTKMEPIDGVFTIVTDGEVLTNNTEDGLTLSGGTKNMRWKVDGTSGPDGSPRAIVKLAN
ncbi:MAG: hypothetical protein COZ43_10620 [Sphingomonadales bacterium CG_4_10_14_3_um_filter_58_15]|nr:hypothetical protein [Sphingomonadales bacterium]PIX64886.1 MAG: hypothetical protein COZ43_10620 [Sphingomonadales bacterium CG_4_10_14_3_um_filter_58_15]